ncbi:MAG: hypothetical protein QM627_07935 [Luteolibacter sp.]
MTFFLQLLLRVFVPLIAVPWAAWHERKILRNGVPLDTVSLDDARHIGVREPEKVRLLHVERIPFFNSRFLHALSKFFPQITPHTIGLSLRHGIYLRKNIPASRLRQLIAHELVHTTQYEARNSLSRFLIDYFDDCLRSGYAESNFEREADQKSQFLSDHPQETGEFQNIRSLFTPVNLKDRGHSIAEAAHDEPN